MAAAGLAMAFQDFVYAPLIYTKMRCDLMLVMTSPVQAPYLYSVIEGELVGSFFRKSRQQSLLFKGTLDGLTASQLWIWSTSMPTPRKLHQSLLRKLTQEPGWQARLFRISR